MGKFRVIGSHVAVYADINDAEPIGKLTQGSEVEAFNVKTGSWDQPWGTCTYIEHSGGWSCVSRQDSDEWPNGTFMESCDDE